MARLCVGVLPCMTTSVIQQLNLVGINNIVDFVNCDLDILSSKVEISYRELLSIRRLLVSEYSAAVIEGANLFDAVVATTSIVPFGCRPLDDLLDGGLLTGEISHIFSSSPILTMNIVSNVAISMKKNVVYVDLLNHFNTADYTRMYQSLSCEDLENALSRIRLVKCCGVLELLQELCKLSDKLCSSVDRFYTSLKLIVVDDVNACILPELSSLPRDIGCGFLAELVRQLQFLAVEFSTAVILKSGRSSNSASTAKQSPIDKLWMSASDTRLDVTDICDENELYSVSGPKQIRVLLSKSKRQPLYNSITIDTEHVHL